VLAASLGAFGAAAVVVLGAGGLTFVMAGALGAIALLGVAPIPFGARAAALVTLCGGGSAIVLSAGAGGGVPRALLTIGVAVLGAGLLLRAWHRASRASRVLVGAGVFACGMWLWQTRALAGLTILDTAWQAWLPEVAPVVLALVLLLSLLAFMNSASTGGCGVWATMLLVWYAATHWLALVAAAWPAHARGPSLERLSPEVVLVDAVMPLFVALLAVGTAQSLAVLGRRAA
jgi:hypothetical protein